MQTAIRYEIIDGDVVLYDKSGNVLKGDDIHLEGDFVVRNDKTATLRGMPQSIGENVLLFNLPLFNQPLPQSIGSYVYLNNLPLFNQPLPQSIGSSVWLNNLPLFNQPLPQSIGSYVYLNNLPLFNLPHTTKEHQNMFAQFLSDGYVLADGIMTRLKSQRNVNGLTAYKTEKLGYINNAPIVWVVTDGNHFAHGKTLKLAKFALAFKNEDRDTSEFKDLDMNERKSPEEWALIYSLITGACDEGCRMFMQGRQLKKSYTLAEIITETKGAYNSTEFKHFFER